MKRIRYNKGDGWYHADVVKESVDDEGTGQYVVRDLGTGRLVKVNETQIAPALWE